MVDKDRGTYSPPTEDSLSYETRRPASRDQAPITLIISGIFLFVLLIAVVIFYNSGLNNHGRVPPDVGDSMGDIKEGKVQEAHPLSDQEMADPANDGANGAVFAPGTETPTRDQAASEAAFDEAPPPAAPILGPLPSQTNNAAITGQPAVSSAAPLQLKPAVQAVAPVTPAVTPTAAPKAATPSGAALVQIGAFESKEIADKEYANVASSYGLFLSGTTKRIEKVETAKGTFYRASFTGFANTDKAKAFCSALKAAGHDCFVK